MQREQLTLGELIACIEPYACIDPNASIEFDFCGMVPGLLASYRGDYSHLAIEWLTDHPESRKDIYCVGYFLAMLKDAIGRKYVGYKGGVFVMHESTPVWVAQFGQVSDTVITGAYQVHDVVYLATAANPE